ncbi:hypothetical protein Glove_256g205 [Diversispora epigaea]|uniref:Uncharacterized protein n=1 Tax=Diversispora epigaea TaxID=1348612 RepID=A0A397IFM7_9GLOM|nr:hypothetical protein Glove_256g205 [Diversispora epigaea]
MHNSGKLPKDLCRVHVNNRQNDKKIHCIKAAKELFRKNDPNIINYDKELLLRMLADGAFHSPEMSDTDEEDHSKTVVNVYDLSWRSAEKKIHCIKAAKELFRKNDPNIINYDKELLLRMLADGAFHSPEMSDTDEEDHSKTVVNVYDLSWRSAEVSIYF